MKRRPFVRRCGHAPGALTPEDTIAIDDFRAMFAALKNPRPWTPGSGADVAIRVGPFIERAHPRPGDDHGPDLIAVALIHPDTPHAAAYLHGRQLGYHERGWLRCDTSTILGAWQPAYCPLTHAAADLDLPAETGMTPARYSVHVEARRADGTGRTLFRLGPYTQCHLADRDAARLNTHLEGKADTIMPGATLRAVATPFDVSDHTAYCDPREADPVALLASAIEQEEAA